MKHFLAVCLFFLVTSVPSFGQSMSCQDLFETVVDNYDSKTTTNCFGSTMLVKATYYRLEGKGFVVAYIKDSSYDFTGKPYIFCGVSSYNWSQFTTSGMLGSYGEAFHEYIMDFECNCY